jgi:hypothetical protein
MVRDKRVVYLVFRDNRGMEHVLEVVGDNIEKRQSEEKQLINWDN